MISHDMPKHVRRNKKAYADFVESLKQYAKQYNQTLEIKPNKKYQYKLLN